MGLLDHLWDYTFAGPRPDRGLGKLRKHHNFYSGSNAGKGTTRSLDQSTGTDVGGCSDDSTTEAMRITRSIVIAKLPGYQNDSPPASPTGWTPPLSLFPGGRFRRSSSNAYKKPSTEGRRSTSSAFDV